MTRVLVLLNLAPEEECCGRAVATNAACAECTQMWTAGEGIHGLKGLYNLLIKFNFNLTEPGLNKVDNLLCEVHVAAVARQKRACAEINTNISPFQPPPYICRIRTLV